MCATADGGTDRWYEFVSSLSKDSGLKKLHPDLTSGDFDSIRPKTLQQCRDNGVTVVRTPDQDKTDFHKALEEMAKRTYGEVSLNGSNPICTDSQKYIRGKIYKESSILLTTNLVI